MNNTDQFILEMRDIVKSFGSVPVLNGTEFLLKKGEIHALIGENGAGKSTLIKGLIGIHAFDSGEIILEGEKVCFNDANEALRNGISVVFQELSQIDSLTVAENIFLSDKTRSLSVLNRKKMIARAEDILREYHIDIDPRKRVEQLSIAKRQLLEIVKAVYIRPRILVLDEPTSSLTQAETEILFDILNELKTSGTSIIYITHRMNEVFQLADTITVLRDGRTVCRAPVAEMDFDTVVKYMVGRDVKLFNGVRENHVRISGSNMLEVRNVCRKGEFENINFELKKGEVLGFAGLVGSGRTEMMQLLFGIRKITSGDILLEGKSIKNKSTEEIIKAGMAMVPESRHLQGLFLEHSVETNIDITTLPQLCSGFTLNRKKMDELAVKMIQQLNIATSSPQKSIGLLSGGNQQKVVLAKWLATKPKVLILDEPTTGIDIQSKSEIHKLIAQLADSGTSIILISSEMVELINNSDRILILNENRIIGEVEAGKTSQEEILNIILKDKQSNKKNGGAVA